MVIIVNEDKLSRNEIGELRRKETREIMKKSRKDNDEKFWLHSTIKNLEDILSNMEFSDEEIKVLKMSKSILEKKQSARSLFRYQLVTEDGIEDVTIDELKSRYTFLRNMVNNHSLREEYRGQPWFQDLVGPKYYGRDEEDKLILRYTLENVYESFRN